MELRLTLDPYDVLVVHLRDGDDDTTVSVQPSGAGIESLQRALHTALADGYGECFWPGLSGGQYWWIFKRTGDTLETIAMWTRGGAALWEHVFRATDAAAWVTERLAAEIDRLSSGSKKSEVRTQKQDSGSDL